MKNYYLFYYLFGFIIVHLVLMLVYALERDITGLFLEFLLTIICILVLSIAYYNLYQRGI